MKRKIVITGTVLALLIIAYLVGQFTEERSATKQQTQRDLSLHRELVQLDRSFLVNIATKPSTITSGTYTLETRFPGKIAGVSSLEVEYSDGQLLKLAGLPIQDIVQRGPVVSWERFDVDEGPAARYVGFIDGDIMWGRVYVEPGQGWREGEPPAYGMWRLSPKAAN